MFQDRLIETWLLRHALSWHTMAMTISQYCSQVLLEHSSGDIYVVGLGLDVADNLPSVLHFRIREIF